MSTNKTQPTEVSVDAFIAALPNAEKRADAEMLCEMVARITGEPATMWGPSMIGFGTFHYRYESGREGDTFLVGFAPRSARHTIYLNVDGGFDAHREALERLGPHTTGAGCLYVKRLRDIDLAVLESLITASVAEKR